MSLCDVQTTFPDMVLRVLDDEDGRTIEGMIVPWDTPARVLKPISGWESYKRGALDRSLAESGRPIPLLVRHSETEPAGVLVGHENRDDGHHAVFRALDTTAGRDALELIRSGLYTGLSVGGWAVPARTVIKRGARGEQLIERGELRLDHVGLVRTPAFETAQVTTVRADEFQEYDPVAAAKARQRNRRLVRLLTSD